MAISRLIGEILLEARQAGQVLQNIEKQAATAFNNMAKSANRATAQTAQSFNNTITQAHRLETSLATVTRGLGALTAGLGLGLGIQQLTQASDSFIRLENRLKAATSGTHEFNDVFQQLREISNVTGTVLEENASAFVRFNLNMDEVGGTVQDTIDIISTLSKSFLIYGTTTTEAIAGTRQLAQAFASGRLQGDEFRSIMENLPAVGRALARVMGKSVGELRELSREGAITAEVILEAMQMLKDQVDSTFEGITPTIAMGMQALRNEFTIWVGEGEKATGIARMFTEALYVMAENIDMVAAAFAAFLGVMGLAAIAGAVVLFKTFALTVGGVATAIIGLGAALGGVTAGIALYNRAQDDSARAAKAHTAALRTLNEVLKEVNAGTEGAAEEFSQLAKAQIEQQQAAIRAKEAELAAAKVAMLERMETAFGVEEAARRIREGDFDSASLNRLENQLKTMRDHLDAYAARVTSVTGATQDAGKATDETTKKVRVLGAAGKIVEYSLNSMGKVVGPMKEIGVEAGKTTKETKALEEQLAKANKVLEEFQGRTVTTAKGIGKQVTSLLDDTGRVIATIDLQTGIITELGNKSLETYMKQEEGTEKVKTSVESANRVISEQEKRWDALRAAQSTSADKIEQRQTGLVTDLGKLWKWFQDRTKLAWADLQPIIDSAMAKIKEQFGIDVKDLGALWAKMPAYVKATIEELKPIWTSFGVWLEEASKEFGVKIDIVAATEKETKDAKSLWKQLQDWWLGQKLVVGFDATVGDAIEVGKKLFSDLYAWLRDELFTEDTFAKLGDAMDRAVLVMRPIWEAFKTWLGNLAWDTIDWGVGQADVAIAAIKQKWEELKTWVSNLAWDTVDWGVATADEAIAVIKQKWEEFKAWFASTGWAVIDWGVATADEAIATTKAKWEEFKAWFSSTAWGVVDWGIATADTAIADIKTKWEDLKVWLAEAAWGVVDWGVAQADVAVAALKAKWEEFKTWFFSLFEPRDEYAGFGPLVAGLGKVVDFWKTTLEEFKNWFFSLFESADHVRGFAPLLAGMETFIARMEERWTEFTTWLSEAFSVDTALAIFDGLVAGFDRAIGKLEDAWNTFKSWFSSQEVEPNKGIAGDAGSDTLAGRAGPDTIEQEVTIKPVTQQEAAAAFQPLIPAAAAAGLAAGEAYSEKWAMKLDHVEPSGNIVDVREFGWDTIKHEWKVLLDSLKNGAQITFGQIKDLFKSIFGPEDSKVLTQELVSSFTTASQQINQIVIDTANNINAVFYDSATYVSTLWTSLATNLQTTLRGIGLAVTTTFANLPEAFTPIQETIAGLAEYITTTFTTVSEELLAIWSTLSEQILEIVTTLASSIVTALQNMVSNLAPVWASIVEGATNTANQVKAVFESAADAMVAAMKRAEAAAKTAEAAAKSANAAAGSGGGGQSLAGGGLVLGPGGPRADKVPLWGSSGEFMQQASAVKYYGVRFMQMINRRLIPKDILERLKASMKGYASGGLISVRGSLSNSLVPSSVISSVHQAATASKQPLLLQLADGNIIHAETQQPNAVELLLRHSTGKRMRSLGNLPRGRG